MATFEFDEDFQIKILACILKDSNFNLQTEGLIKPAYFTQESQIVISKLGLDFFRKFRKPLDIASLGVLLKEALKRKLFRESSLPEVKDMIKRVWEAEVTSPEFVVEQIGEFARYRAMESALENVISLMEKRELDKAFEIFKVAAETAPNTGSQEYDFWEKIKERSEQRRLEAAGLVKPNGITTGNSRLDSLLKHKGWGRGELASLMGGAKSGKSTALGCFASAAALAGFNVLLVSLEVSKEIIAERLDATLSRTPTHELTASLCEVEKRISSMSEKGGLGKFYIHEYPSGTLTPAELRRLIQKYKSSSVKFDLIVVDYADIMLPDFRTTDPIENSKSIYLALRAIAQEEGAAMLTATQTNREGMKSTVAKMTHVSDDINRARIVDLMISLNVTEEERSEGIMRLYFAASRNQKGDFTVVIKQDLSTMTFLTEVLRYE
jgi:replicative DNA helicase